MLEGAINAGKGFIGSTADVCKNNTQGAVGVGILAIVGWELFGRKMCLWSKNKIQKSAIAEAARTQTAKLLKKDDSDHELRAQVMATTKKVDALAEKAAEKIADKAEKAAEKIADKAEKLED